MRQIIADSVLDALCSAAQAGELGPLVADDLASMDPSIERPREEGHGEWASTICMRLSKQAHMQPRQIAEVLLAHFPEFPFIDSIEVAGPGFINFHLSQTAYQQMLVTAHDQGMAYGSGQVETPQKVQVEFVSANPTGPMHIGHGRWAALGNAMANVLAHVGHEVEREFYINDAGSQMLMFGKSVSARYLSLCGIPTDVPEGGYGGAYVTDIAQGILDNQDTDWLQVDAQEREEAFKELAYRQMLQRQKDVLHDLGVDFQVWFSERDLHAKDAQGANDITRAFDTLKEAGYLYESEGALWFRTTDLGDDKDRVLVKADGDYTYFAADVAYHANKFSRGFDRVINIWGADHHGYVPRMMAAVAALGYPGQLEIVLGQLVNLFRNGEAVRMSKRTGEMITLEELVEEVGADATKYLMLSRSTDQPIDFDIEVAKKQDSTNPVYYVQYAHARICSLLAKAQESGLAPEQRGLELLTDEAELALIRCISEFPETIAWAAQNRAPFRLTHYAEELASHFHQFYTRCHIIGEDEDLSRGRLYLADTTRTVLALTLKLLGVTAPDRM